MASGEEKNNGLSMPSLEEIEGASSANCEITVLDSSNELNMNTASDPSVHLLPGNKHSINQGLLSNFSASSPNETIIKGQTPQLSHLSAIGSGLNQIPCLSNNDFSGYQSNVSQLPIFQVSRSHPIVNEYPNPLIGQIPTSERQIFSRYESNVSHPIALNVSRSHPIVNEYSNRVTDNHSEIEMGFSDDSSSPWFNGNDYNLTQYFPILTQQPGENASMDFQDLNLNTHDLFQENSLSSSSANSGYYSLLQKLYQNRVNESKKSSSQLPQSEKITSECFNAPSPKLALNVIVVGVDATTPLTLIQTYWRKQETVFQDEDEKPFRMLFQKEVLIIDVLLEVRIWYLSNLALCIGTLKSFCKSSITAIILVYDVTEQNSLSFVRQAIQVLKRVVATNVPIVLVGNNRDCEILASNKDSNNISIMNRPSYSEGLKVMHEFKLLEFFECSVDSVDHVDVIFENAIHFAYLRGV